MSWPGQPDWDSNSYWMGVASTLAFMQADLDTEASFKAGRNPTLRARLPWLEAPKLEDLEAFGVAVDVLNEDCKVLYWRRISTTAMEHIIELGSTEGYCGMPKGWEQQDWR